VVIRPYPIFLLGFFSLPFQTVAFPAFNKKLQPVFCSLCFPPTKGLTSQTLGPVVSISYSGYLRLAPLFTHCRWSLRMSLVSLTPFKTNFLLPTGLLASLPHRNAVLHLSFPPSLLIFRCFNKTHAASLISG